MTYNETAFRMGNALRAYLAGRGAQETVAVTSEENTEQEEVVEDEHSE